MRIHGSQFHFVLGEAEKYPGREKSITLVLEAWVSTAKKNQDDDFQIMYILFDGFAGSEIPEQIS